MVSLDMTDSRGSMAPSSPTSMSHMHLDMATGMNMFLTNSCKAHPVLFAKLSAANDAQASGIFFIIFVACFVAKAL